VRARLGASRLLIVRQLLAEIVLIAAAAPAGGDPGAVAVRVLVGSLTTQGDRVVVQVASDCRMFSFIALLATVACVVVTDAGTPATATTRAQP